MTLYLVNASVQLMRFDISYISFKVHLPDSHVLKMKKKKKKKKEIPGQKNKKLCVHVL